MDSDVVKIRVLLDVSSAAPAQKAVRQTLSGVERDYQQHVNRLKELRTRHESATAQIALRGENQVTAIHARAHAQQLAQARRHQQAMQRIAGGAGVGRAAGYAGIAVAAGAAGGIAFAKEAIGSYKEYDRLINMLRASEGTLDKARSKYTQLFAEGQKLVGLTGRDLVESYAFLRNSLDGSVESSEKLAKSFGKVRALFSDFDPRKAASNIRQLIGEKFQIQDLREMENQAPGFQRGLFGEFGVKSVEELRKRLKGLDPTINELQSRLANVFDGLGAKSDTFITKIAKIGAQFREALVPLGEWLGNIGLQIINQLSPAFSDLGARVGGFFGKIAPHLQIALTTGVEFWAEMIRGFNALDERFAVFDKMALVVNRFFDATSLLNSGFIRVAQTIRSVLGGAIDWLRGSLSNLLGSMAGAFEGASSALPGFMGGDKSRGAALKLREAQIAVNTFGGRNAAIPTNIVAAGIGGGGGGGGTRYNDFGGSVGGASGGKKTQAQKDAESRQSLIEAGRQAREKMTLALSAREDADFLRERMNTQQLSRVAVTYSSDAAMDERLRQGRLSRSALTLDFERKEEVIEKQREALEKLEPVLSNTQRFMTGLRGETDALGNAFERFGDSVGNAFGDVRNLFGGLKDAIKSFFGDITAGVLRNVVGAALSPLLAAGRISRGNDLQSFGNPGNFLTGGFAGGNPAMQILTGGGGWGNVGQTFSQTAAMRANTSSVISETAKWFGSSVPARAGNVGFFSGLGNSLKSAFSGANGPLFGAGIGSMFGGQSVAGNILGSAGGALATGFITSSLGLMGTGTAAALFSNPFTAIAGAGLLVGSVLLGRAKQRRADESLVDTYWVEYREIADKLTRDVRANRIDGDSALAQAMAARQQAIDQIGQIKTKSVRESRLRNQIPQIDNSSLARLKEAISAQGIRRDLAGRWVPEFATGGYMPYDGFARLHAGEVILNANQQMRVGQQALASAGVPGLGGNSGGGSGQPQIVVELTNVIGTQEQSEIIIGGINHPSARKPLGQALSNLARYGG